MISENRQEQIALVTGSARRIGAAIASALHEQGFNILIHCHHSLEEAAQLANNLNRQRAESARVVQVDLQAPLALERVLEAIGQWGGSLAVLVNNASLFIKDEWPFNEKDWQAMFRLNVQIPYQLSQAAFPLLKAQQGIIINLTDIHAQRPLTGYSIYCQTKAALVLQTLSLAKEFAPDVRVNAIAPGAIMWPENTNRLSRAVQEKIIAQTPLKKHGDPLYISAAVLALINNPFITGQVLNVDGGRSI